MPCGQTARKTLTCTTINPVLWHVLYSEWLLVTTTIVLQAILVCDVSVVFFPVHHS